MQNELKGRLRVWRAIHHHRRGLSRWRVLVWPSTPAVAAELWPSLLWPDRTLRHSVRPNAAKLRGLKHLQRGEIPKISHPLQLVDADAKKSTACRDPGRRGDRGSEVPVYLKIIETATHLSDLGMSDRAIARALGVSDKTVAKAIGGLEAHRPNGIAGCLSVLLSFESRLSWRSKTCWGATGSEARRSPASPATACPTPLRTYRRVACAHKESRDRPDESRESHWADLRHGG